VQHEHAGALAQLLCAFMFLGGAVGKLTSGYLDGAVLHGIYYEAREHWTFALSRAALDPAALRDLALLHSRGVLGIEFALATAFLWPTRRALPAMLIAYALLVLLHNFRLMSVVGPLCAACIAAILLLRDTRRAQPETAKT
jgi:hypothetical protein